MIKIAQLDQIARDNGWEVKPCPGGPIYERQVGTAREYIDLFLTNHNPPRLTRANVTVVELVGAIRSQVQYPASEAREAVIARLTTPADQPVGGSTPLLEVS